MAVRKETRAGFQIGPQVFHQEAVVMKEGIHEKNMEIPRGGGGICPACPVDFYRTNRISGNAVPDQIFF